jgi:hypothetical protein
MSRFYLDFRSYIQNLLALGRIRLNNFVDFSLLEAQGAGLELLAPAQSHM